MSRKHSRKFQRQKPANGAKPDLSSLAYLRSSQIMDMALGSMFRAPTMKLGRARALCGYRWRTPSVHRYRSSYSDHGWQGERERTRRRRQMGTGEFARA